MWLVKTYVLSIVWSSMETKQVGRAPWDTSRAMKLETGAVEAFEAGTNASMV